MPFLDWRLENIRRTPAAPHPKMKRGREKARESFHPVSGTLCSYHSFSVLYLDILGIQLLCLLYFTIEPY